MRVIHRQWKVPLCDYSLVVKLRLAKAVTGVRLSLVALLIAGGKFSDSPSSDRLLFDIQSC